MTKKSRRKFGADFKAKVVLEALKERSTIEEIARKYKLHPTQINTWKKEAIANMAAVFGSDKSESGVDHEKQTRNCTPGLDSLRWRTIFLKKSIVRPVSKRRSLIDNKHSLSVVKQCELLGLHRSGLYYKPCCESDENLAILRLLDEQYFKTPFY
jgi:transposase-like protein